MCLLMGIVGAVGGFYYRFNSLDIDGQYFNEVIWRGGIVGVVSAFITLLVISAAKNEKRVFITIVCWVITLIAGGVKMFYALQL